MQTEHESQLDALYAHHAPAIQRYLARLTGSEETAEDLTQETFLKAWRRWGQLASVEGARSWLFRIATNTAYDHFRRRRRQPTTRLGADHAETLVAETVGLPIEERELLWALVARLPERYRLPLLLQSYAGYKLNDIATLLGWSEGTVKSRLHRARAQVQKQYAAD
jgi:RNA polymerase sigma-70 factor (ECF subfamily)